jgi:hypothetical protein
LSPISNLQSLNLKHTWPAPLVFVVALCVYTATLAPDITWAHDGGDGGDLISAVMTGGVPHPPGYSTYLLLTWPLAHVDLGNPAGRLGLFSALCAAGAASLVAQAVIRLSSDLGHIRASKLAGVCAGLMLALSPVLWSQAVITEVYTLGALFAVLLLWLASRRLTGWRAIAFGVTWGAALGAYLPLILSAVLAVGALERRWKDWLWAGLGVLTGLGVFCILPLRAASHAPINWGNAVTLEGFWWLVSAQLYRGYVMAVPLQSLGARLLGWASMMARQFTPVGLLLGLLGLWQLARARPVLAWTTVALVAGYSIFAIGYNTTDSYVHLIPSFVCLALWLGVGLAHVIDLIGSRNLPGLSVLLLPLVMLVAGWSAADLHADRTAIEFGEQVLAQAPANAVLITSQDAHTFTMWYYHYVRGQRPDALVLDLDMLSMLWYRRSLSGESQLMLNPPDALTELKASGRPVCRVSLNRLECD